MSTYDAYNLSLRDSTEFTVPTGGGSGGDSDYELVNVTFVNNSANAIQYSCSVFVNDPQYESFTGFAKNIVTQNGLMVGDSIAMNMLIPTGGAAICMYEPVEPAHMPMVNATGDIRIIDNPGAIIIYGSGTVTFSGGSNSGGGK